MTIKLQVSAENREELISYLDQEVMSLIRNDFTHGHTNSETYWEINEIN